MVKYLMKYVDKLGHKHIATCQYSMSGSTTTSFRDLAFES